MQEKNAQTRVEIDASTKVAALLNSYPELEETLIGIAPPFKKLKNPILRRSVAKVASLRQAAAVGRVPAAELVNILRAAVGQDAIEVDGEDKEYFPPQPDWFDRERVVSTIDEGEDVDPDSMAITKLVQMATKLAGGDIIELTTTFLPAPGIDLMVAKGYLVWSERDEPGLVRTYFSKALND